MNIWKFIPLDWHMPVEPNTSYTVLAYEHGTICFDFGTLQEAITCSNKYEQKGVATKILKVTAEEITSW